MSVIIDKSCYRFDSEDCLTIFRKLELTHGRAYLKRLLT
jgi:hypothetical protein